MLFSALKRNYGVDIYKNSPIECIQLIAKEEYEVCSRLEKIKTRIIRNELTRQRLSSTFQRFRTSLRISFTRSHNSVVPQESFKENDIKTTSTNSNNESTNANKNKKKGGGINPMITILFLGMTFKAWKSFCLKKNEGILLSDDSLPVKSEDEDDWEEDESEENYDEFDDQEQKDFESKAMKNRRVGFANFGEIKEEDEGDDRSNNSEDSNEEDKNYDKNGEIKDNKENP